MGPLCPERTALMTATTLPYFLAYPVPRQTGSASAPHPERWAPCAQPWAPCGAGPACSYTWGPRRGRVMPIAFLRRGRPSRHRELKAKIPVSSPIDKSNFHSRSQTDRVEKGGTGAVVMGTVRTDLRLLHLEPCSCPATRALRRSGCRRPAHLTVRRWFGPAGRADRGTALAH